jgi:glycosyltransferase involved in cell wall biosynthesis
MNPDAKPGLLLVGNFLSHAWGTRGVCEDLAERLREAGWARVLTTSHKPGRLARLLDMVGTVVRRRREFDVAQVDVYSGPAYVWADVVCQVLRAVGKPCVLTLHGGNLPAFAARWPGRVRRLLRAAHTVTTPSRYLREQMRVYRDDLTLLPNALDLAAYQFHHREQAQPRLMWLRAFHSIYNPAMALHVVANLAREFPHIQLTMVGPDKGDGSLPSFQQTAERLGVTDRVALRGAVPKAQVPETLSAGDIFLNTTNFDNTPVSVIEAMACGLCVVSTDVGGIPYLLAHETDALVVPKGDANAMTQAVRRLLTEHGLAARLSRHARAKVEPFDWSAVLPQWEAIFRRVLARPAPRPVEVPA